MNGIKMTDAVKHLLILNVLMFVGTLAIQNGVFFNTHFALFFTEYSLFKPWQVLTHMFMHGSPSHILFNMFALWMFGTAVEQVFGTKKFVVFYILAGLGAAVIQLGVNHFEFNSIITPLVEAGFSKEEVISAMNTNGLNSDVVSPIIGAENFDKLEDVFYTRMVGASGAIMGVLVAFGMLFPNSKLMLIFLPVPVKAKYFIPVIIGLDLISALTGQSFMSPNNTAYVAHLGGALAGFLMVYFWKKDEFDSYRWN